VDGRIILRWIFRKWDVWEWTRSSWLRIGTRGGNLTAVMNLRIPYNARNFLTSCKPVSFSRRIVLHGVSKEYILFIPWRAIRFKNTLSTNIRTIMYIMYFTINLLLHVSAQLPFSGSLHHFC
jgi:hypothetical protein